MKTAPCGMGGTAAVTALPHQKSPQPQAGSLMQKQLRMPSDLAIAAQNYLRHKAGKNWGSEGKTKASGVLRSQRKFRESLGFHNELDLWTYF